MSEQSGKEKVVGGLPKEFAVVYKPGTRIKLGLDGGIPAQIVEVAIRPNNFIQYRVVWWNGRERKNEWIESYEHFTVDIEPENYGKVRFT